MKRLWSKLIRYMRDQLMPPLVAVLLLIGCGEKAPQYTADESWCMAEAEARYQRSRASCGDDVASECSTDYLVDRQKAEVSKCFRK